jgi:hypothetical protein
LGDQDIVPGQTERVQASAEDGIVTSPLEEDLEQMADPTHEEPGVPQQPIEQMAAEPAPLPAPPTEPEPALRDAMESFLEDAAPDSTEAEFDADGQPAPPEALPTETVQLGDNTVVEQPPLQIDAPVDLSETLAMMPVGDALEAAVLGDAATDDAENVAEDAAQPARRQRRRRRKPGAQSNGEQPTSEAAGEQPAAA